MKNCTLIQTDQWEYIYPTQEKLLLHYKPSVIYAKIFFYCFYTLFGIFGNTLSSIIWLLPDLRRKNNSAYYLASLGITDALITIFIVIILITGCFGELIHDSLSVLNNAIQYFSVSLVFGFTLERFISVCFPFKRQKLCTVKRTLLTIGILLVISIILATLGQVYIGNRWILVFNEITFSIIVPTSALIMNIKVIFEMKRISRSSTADKDQNNSSKEQQNFLIVTTMLVTLSMYVIFCNLIAGGLYIYSKFLPDVPECTSKDKIEGLEPFQQNLSYLMLIQITDIFTISHYALNCFIYFLTNKNFRMKFISLTCRLCCRRKSRNESQLRSVSDAKNSRRRENRTRLLNSTISTQEDASKSGPVET